MNADRAQEYRRFNGMASRAAFRKPTAGNGDYAEPLKPWKGYQRLNDAGEWQTVSDSMMCAILDANGLLRKWLDTMRGGTRLMIGDTMFRWTNGIE